MRQGSDGEQREESLKKKKREEGEKKSYLIKTIKQNRCDRFSYFENKNNIYFVRFFPMVLSISI